VNAAARPALSVGFVLCPNFTLVAFAAFVDALRLAADEGDRSRPIHCRWSVLSHDMRPIRSSAGLEVKPTAELPDPAGFDYIVVVGGLTDGPRCHPALLDYLQLADQKGVPLVGLCTGSFVLARLGLMSGRRCCVSWYHHEAFAAEFPTIAATSAELFVVDHNRITCAGGTSVVHAASHLIARHGGSQRAQKALRILIEEQPLPPSAPQPLSLATPANIDPRVRKAVLLIEQDCEQVPSIDAIAQRVHLSTRQLERLFLRDLGMTPSVFGEKFRLARARQLLHTATEPLYAVALKCGYKNPSHFASRFRAEFGVSPSSLRSQTNALKGQTSDAAGHAALSLI
jgi:transcriptional regulator GlxA family with amidase domain